MNIRNITFCSTELYENLKKILYVFVDTSFGGAAKINLNRAAACVKTSSAVESDNIVTKLHTTTHSCDNKSGEASIYNVYRAADIIDVFQVPFPWIYWWNTINCRV